MVSKSYIFKITYPIILSLLAQNIINITDTAFLGHVGKVELGGSALGGLWYLTIFMAGFGFSIGTQVLMARRNGEGRPDKIGPIFIQGLMFLLILGAGIIAATDIIAAPLLSKIVKSEKVLEATTEFIDWRIWGLLFSFPNVMFRAYFVAVTKTKALTISAVIMAIVNVFLDYAMIFGKFGFEPMGLKGAAIASVIAEAASVAFFVIYFIATTKLKNIGLHNRSAYNFRLLPHILNVSIWTMLQSFFALGTWFVFFIATEHLGETSLAVSNIVRSVSSAMFMFTSAYGTTANTLISNLMGEGRIKEIPLMLRRVIVQCGYFVFPIMLFVILFPKLILHIYSSDTTFIDATLPSLIVMMFSYILVTPGMIFHQAISGTGNTRSALGIEVITLVAYMSYVVVTAFVLKADVSICWGSEFVYWGIIGLLSYTYLLKGNWRTKKI